MSCRKKCFGRFAPIQFESDNCRKGKEYIPLWKKDFNAQCFDVCNDAGRKELVCRKPCSYPCDPVMPCHDFTCKKNCTVPSCVPGRGYLFSNPCRFAPPCHDNGCVCKSTRPCGSKPSGHFPELCSGACGSPCSLMKPCHDIKNVFKRIRTDCRGLQPCGEESIGRFPFSNVKLDGACCKPEREDFCFH
ncbi:hypothetical protein E1301_Tti014078 [Triplophysa tibetana]|uniref:Uncharacterized protein n=1 Tax=Triplophysa tibetana TaxID=1572043 RepID=A0A5A9NC19_9TELE|nr:hypothetical protein E1301_Tti014078 [Triplophysa tibetana]